MLHISVHVVSCLCIRSEEEEEEICGVLSSQVLPIPSFSVREEAVSDEQSRSCIFWCNTSHLKMLIGFCFAGLAGSPASRKPAWKAVLLWNTLLTHLACSSGYPSFCDDRTLLASLTYQGLPPRLVSRWMRCPLDVLRLLVNSFASSFLDLRCEAPSLPRGLLSLKSCVGKVLACPLRHQPRKVSKSFLYMGVKSF